MTKPNNGKWTSSKQLEDGRYLYGAAAMAYSIAKQGGMLNVIQSHVNAAILEYKTMEALDVFSSFSEFFTEEIEKLKKS